MDIPRIDFHVWYVVGALAVIELALIARYVQMRQAGLAYTGAVEMRGTAKVTKSLGRDGVRTEIERLRAGGEVDNNLINSFSQEERVLFEVAIIDALTIWTVEQKTKLRRSLVRHGFDEQCTRRLLNGDLSGHVRASTVLGLLRVK